jgi:hypothetical protein
LRDLFLERLSFDEVYANQLGLYIYKKENQVPVKQNRKKNKVNNGKDNIDPDDKVFMSDEEATNENEGNIKSDSNDDTANLLNQLEVTVKPGSLGISADWKTGVGFAINKNYFPIYFLSKLL